jgi:hypothetical protein
MGMMRRTWSLLATLSALVAFGICTHAQAGLIPTSVTIAPDGGNFRWTYGVDLTSNVHVQSGDFFTIYDFSGLVTGPGNSLSNIVPPSGWTVTSSMVGQTPPGVSPVDNASVANLTFTYSGPTITSPGSLGNFWAISTEGSSTTADFTSLTHTNAGGSPEANITTTSAPVIGAIANSPEPATLAMLGLSLPVFCVGRWLRRQLSK